MSNWPKQRWFWFAFAALLYSPSIDTNPGLGNVASDLAAIESIVEGRTFFINGSTFEDTIDKFKRVDEELYFSQKSPIFHLAAAIPYAALVSRGYRISSDLALCLRVLTLFMVVLPMGWLLWLVHSHPWARDRSGRFRLLMTFAFAFGSLLTPFAVTLNHYILSSAFLLAAVHQLARGVPAGSTGYGSAFKTGVLVSAALVCDVPPPFLFGAALATVWLFRATRRLGFLALGAAPLLLLYAALNTAIVGSPLPPNLHEEEMLYFEGSYWSEIRAQAERGEPGYYQASYPRRLFHATLGHKGIYWMMPLLAAATLGAVVLKRKRSPGWTLAVACASFPIVAIAVVMIWAFDLSGGAYAIRHVFATIPPLFCVLLHPDLASVMRKQRPRLWAAGLWGCAIAWIGVLNPWSHNTLSAIPPLENVARVCLRQPYALPTDWIPGLIRTTSVKQPNAWLDLGLEFKSLGERSVTGAIRLSQQGRIEDAENMSAQAARWLAEAELNFLTAIEADPRVVIPYYHLGIAQDMQGKFDAAIATYHTLLELDPENFGAWNNLTIFALHAGRLEWAELANDQSLSIVPNNPSGLRNRLIVQEVLKQRRAIPPPARDRSPARPSLL